MEIGTRLEHEPELSALMSPTRGRQSVSAGKEKPLPTPVHAVDRAPDSVQRTLQSVRTTRMLREVNRFDPRALWIVAAGLLLITLLN